MNKFSKIIIAFAAILAIHSCTDLEEDLVGDITKDITVEGFDTEGGNSGVLSGAFSELRTGSAGHGSYYSLQELPSDEMVICAKGGDWFDGGILVELHQHTYTPTHAFVNDTWNNTYGAINTVNELLDGDPVLDANQTAQAKALRAYFYWRLMDLYGNVKIITSPGVDAPQASRLEVFNFVESELLAALGVSEVSSSMDLSASPLQPDGDAYQINQFAALGILGKVYLNAEVYSGTARYAEAAAAASYIIDSGVYSLCGDGCTVANLGKRGKVDSDPEELEGFAAVFAPNNEGNPEHIFTINYDEATGEGMNFSQMNLHYSSQFTWNLDNQPWNGYATLEEFYNSYDDGDIRKKASFIAGEQLDFSGFQILDYAADDESVILNYNPKINELQPNSLREAGARAGKFSFKQFGRDNMDNDYPVVRLGDVYLMRGEAMARMNANWNDALPDVNIIRARAKVPALSSIDADEFLAERGREMFQESSRRTDLIRFDKYKDTWWEKPVSEDYRSVFPIPFDQITASDGTLSQNPGY